MFVSFFFISKRNLISVILEFSNLQITNIQTISLSQRNSEDTYESVFDVLPVVDLNGIVQRGYDLDFHSRFDVDAVAAFAAFGSYSVECHNKFSFCCYSFPKAKVVIHINIIKFILVHIQIKDTQCLHITSLGFQRQCPEIVTASRRPSDLFLPYFGW